ncbi:MAG: hypothetical protein WBA93_15740 [Microcoleaceae cyanobacterium]
MSVGVNLRKLFKINDSTPHRFAIAPLLKSSGISGRSGKGDRSREKQSDRQSIS